MSRSFDNLNTVNKETTLEKKKKSVFSKLFKFRTLQSPSRKKTTKEKSKKGSSNRSSVADEVKDRESALTNSISMPEIASELIFLPRMLFCAKAANLALYVQDCHGSD